MVILPVRGGGGGGGGEVVGTSPLSETSQYPRNTSPSCEVNPSDPIIDGQHCLSIFSIALQQPVPKKVSPFKKKSIISPVHAWSSNNVSQHPDEPPS